MAYPRVIILEGIDKTGKSTLAKELAKETGNKIIKVSNPKGDAFEEYMTLLDNVTEPVIFDRFHLGELVYGPHKRNKSDLDDYKFERIENRLFEMEAVIIYTYNTVEFIKQKFIEDKETFLTKEDIEPILVLYEFAVDKSRLPIIRYRIGDGYNWFSKKLNIF